MRGMSKQQARQEPPKLTWRRPRARKSRVMGIFWKCARIGERLSPYISICCVLMAVRATSPLLSSSPAPSRNPLFCNHPLVP